MRPTTDVADCPQCGGEHADLPVYTGHQGRSTYAFCPMTRKAFTLANGHPVGTFPR